MTPTLVAHCCWSGVLVHLSALCPVASHMEMSQYWDLHLKSDSEEQEKLLEKSCMLYVGNLSLTQLKNKSMNSTAKVVM